MTDSTSDVPPIGDQPESQEVFYPLVMTLPTPDFVRLWKNGVLPKAGDEVKLVVTETFTSTNKDGVEQMGMVISLQAAPL